MSIFRNLCGNVENSKSETTKLRDRLTTQLRALESTYGKLEQLVNGANSAERILIIFRSAADNVKTAISKVDAAKAALEKWSGLACSSSASSSSSFISSLKEQVYSTEEIIESSGNDKRDDQDDTDIPIREREYRYTHGEI